MKSLVTGGAGFIGSHVAKHCLNLNHEVVVLDDLSGGFADHIPDGAEFVHGSITNQEMVHRLFQSHKFDYVYHLAAYAAEGLSHFIRHFNYTNNLIGSINLINEAVNNDVKCFVYTSSIAVYGTGQLPLVEDIVPKPEDPYGISKYAVELDLHAAKEMFGLNFVIFRPHNVYGEYQNIGDRYRNVIGIFINQLMNNQKLTIFGDGNQTRAFSYIDDVAPYISSCVNIPEALNQVINIGADTPYSVNDLVEIIGKHFREEPQVKYLPARNEVIDAYADHSKANRIFNITHTTPISVGIEKMVEWAKVVGARKSLGYQSIEVDKNMPQIWKQPLQEG